MSIFEQNYQSDFVYIIVKKVIHEPEPTSMFPRAFVNLRVGTIARLMDLFRLLVGLSGRSPVDEFLFPFNIDSIFSFFRAISSLCCLQIVKKDILLAW